MAAVELFHETGEQFLDSETGEIKQAVTCVRSVRFTNAETGEPEVRTSRKRRFQVPRSLQTGSLGSLEKQESLATLDSQGSQGSQELPQDPPEKEESNCFEKSMVRGAQNVSPVVFMLPTLLFFPAWASMLCLLLETCIHVWSHKRNRLKTDAHIRYRSPLHLITSEFCAHCQTDKWMQKIGRIQDRRTLRRKLIHPDIIKGVVR